MKVDSEYFLIVISGILRSYLSVNTCVRGMWYCCFTPIKDFQTSKWYSDIELLNLKLYHSDLKCFESCQTNSESLSQTKRGFGQISIWISSNRSCMAHWNKALFDDDKEIDSSFGLFGEKEALKS